jgi:uncharacterized protein YjbI with pentapeptide repeats
MRNRSAIIGYAVLTLILTAGAAQGLAGTDTVTSDDVVNESLTSADIKNESLTSSDIKNESLRGSDVLNNSLTGSDINEATLARARNVHFAHGSIGGSRVRGDAIDVDRISTGRYEVTFSGFDVRSCVWTGSEADFIGASASLASKRYVVSVESSDDVHDVTVYITGTDTGTRVNASFALIGVCP